MTLTELKKIRLTGKAPFLPVKISLCPGDNFKEPVLRLGRDDDLSVLHGLNIDVCYWKQAAKALEIIKRLIDIKPKSLSAVNHRIGQCVMVYWNGETMIDDQSFLYDWKGNKPYE